MKECKECKKLQPFVCFYKNKSTKDGLWPECKKCNILRSIKWKKNNSYKSKKLYKKYWTKHRKKLTVQLKNNYNKRNFNGLREVVIKRDKYKCVDCGFTRKQHKQKWKIDLNVDHLDRDRNNNMVENLQTLCLKCHGSKSGKEKGGEKL